VLQDSPRYDIPHLLEYYYHLQHQRCPHRCPLLSVVLPSSLTTLLSLRGSLPAPSYEETWLGNMFKQANFQHQGATCLRTNHAHTALEVFKNAMSSGLDQRTNTFPDNPEPKMLTIGERGSRSCAPLPTKPLHRFSHVAGSSAAVPMSPSSAGAVSHGLASK
jgi:hypothetical protein